jgi:hypothetical protein
MAPKQCIKYALLTHKMQAVLHPDEELVFATGEK